MKKFSKILSMIVVLSLCISCFAACSMFDKSPKTAAELIAKSNEALDGGEKSMHADLDLDFNIGMDMEAEGAKMSMKVPVEMNAGIDVAGDYMHIEMDMEGSAKVTIEYEGEKQTEEEDLDESTEIYIVQDGDEVITYTKDGDAWYVTEEEVDDESLNVRDLLDEEIFKDAEMTKDGDNYVVKVKMADILKNEKFKEAMGEINSDDLDSLGLGLDMEIDEIVDVLGDATFTYKFNKDFYPVEMSTGKIVFDVSNMLDESDLEEAGMDADDIDISMEMTIKFSKFGEIEEDDVKVPKKVKEEATSGVIVDDDDEGVDDNDVSVPDEDDKTTEPTEDDKPVTSNGTMSDTWSDLTVKIDGVVYEFPYDYTLLKSNGWELDLKGMGYEDGYVLNKNDQLSGTIDLYNAKYNSPDAYDAFTFWCGFQNFSDKVQDITECDLWCIELDMMDAFEPVDKYPDVKIAKGITWGSTMDEVVAAFGEPAEKYESKGDGYDYARCEWRTEDGKYMTLTVDAKYGVTAIEFDCY